MLTGFFFDSEMISKVTTFFLLAIVCVAGTLSCASESSHRKEVPPSSLPAQEIESSRQVKAMNERILMSSLSSGKDLYRDYKIGPEDLIEVSVFEEEKLNKTVRVSSQGNISLPLLGILRVKGLTANELEREIRELLAEKYLRDPHVSVFIKEYRSQRISVIGAVEKPGPYDVTGQKTILGLLGMAGGLKEDAGTLLFLIRPPQPEEGISPEAKGSEPVKPSTFVIDLEELLVKGDLSLNLPLVHGDVINIPISGKIFVGGEVRRPGGFPLKGKRVTVSQAIAMAEGLKPEADGGGARIFRTSGNGSGREILPADIYAIQKGQGEDRVLKENDILIVPKSGTKAFFIGLLDTVKGLVGFGFSLGAL
jgi:polysaccharide export outer membrane protein